MNKREFFNKLALAAAGFAILPAATTYARTWRPATTASVIHTLNPAWVNAEYVMEFMWHPRAFMILGSSPDSGRSNSDFRVALSKPHIK